MPTNLPVSTKNDSAAGTKLFFDNYGIEPLEFNAIDVDAATAFFEKKGFGKDASLVVAATILKQAKLDNVPIFKLLDSLGNNPEMNISTLVGEILNNNRTPTSTLGFRIDPVIPNQIRNVLA
jgi:hypothetical protein